MSTDATARPELLTRLLGRLPAELRDQAALRARLEQRTRTDAVPVAAGALTLVLACVLAFAPTTWRLVSAVLLVLLGTGAGLLVRSRLVSGPQRRRYDRLVSAVDSVSTGLVVLDERGAVMLQNPAIAQTPGAELLDPSSPEGALARALRGEPVREESLVTSGAGPRHVRVQALPLLDDDGEPRGAVGSLLDVTAEWQAHNDLQAVFRARRSVLAEADVRTAVCRSARDATGALLSVLFEIDGGSLVATAQAGSALDDLRFAVSSDTVVAQTYRSARARVVPQLHDEAHYAARQAEKLERQTGQAIGAVAYLPLLSDGRCRGVLMTVLDSTRPVPSTPTLAVLELLAGEAVLALGREDMHAQLVKQSRTDPLTGLPNRRALPDHLSHLPRSGGIAVVEMDGFADYVDANGHPAGDSLLVHFATVLQRTIRSEDIAVRLGGTGFGLLVPDGGSLVGLLARLRLAWDDEKPGVCFSAGIGLHDPRQSPDETLRVAEDSCGAAQRAGGGRTFAADGECVQAVLTPPQLRALQLGRPG